VAEKYRIGPFLLDAEAHALTHTGKTVPLGQRAVDVLAVLVRAAPECVPKTRIMEAAWSGLIVEESNLSVQISAIRRALAQAPGGEDWLETLARRGYRFTGPVTALPENKTARDTVKGARSNLAEPLTSFVGRERQVAEIQRLLSSNRLVTLIGAGGVGKTRIAIRVAGELLHSYADGVWLVEFGALRDPVLVPQTVATVLGLSDQPGKSLTQLLAEHLESRQLLLVLDNTEHLIAACAQFVYEVMRHCEQVAILATSRERLGLAGELTYRVPPLSTPSPQREMTAASLAPYESVQLFKERAQLFLPQFALTDQNAQALTRICQQLDGIPLAIELAAARVRSMSVEEVNHRLDQRFRLLTGGSRAAPRRQQTLRAVFDWSYDLLSDAEKALLNRLSVFSGGWTIEAAEQVCSGDGIETWEMLDHLTALTDKSLVVAEERNGATRYWLLETVRQYAWDRLIESSDGRQLRDAQFGYFLKLAENAEPQLRGTEQHVWLERLEAEHDNIRAALRWSSGEGAVTSDGLQLAAAFWPFWLMRGHFREGGDWLSRLLAAPPVEGPLPARARALRGSGVMAELRGDYPAARALYEQSIAICRGLGDRRGIAAVLNNLGSVASAQGDEDTALGLWEESLAIRRDMGDALGIADLLGNLGKVAYHRGDYSSARSMWEESLAISRHLNDLRGITFSLSNLGRVALEEGDFARSRAMWDESRDMARELGDRWGMAWSLMNLGDLASAERDFPTAERLHQESLAIRREIGNRPCIADSLERLANIALAVSRPLRGARIWGAVERLREELGVPQSPDEHLHYEQCIAAARDAFHDDAAFSSAWQVGRAMTVEKAIALALETGDEG
jgi:non-specific serine/threonine protein kinase